MNMARHKSGGSLDTEIIGLSFKIFSISTENVHKVSSLRSRSPINEYKILLVELMSLSQTPPSVARWWWIELPFNSSISQGLDPLLIPHFLSLNSVQFGSSEISTVITVNNYWGTSSTNKA